MNADSGPPARWGVTFATQSPYIPAPGEPPPKQPPDDISLPDGMYDVAPGNKQLRDNFPIRINNEKLASVGGKLRPH